MTDDPRNLGVAPQGRTTANARSWTGNHRWPRLGEGEQSAADDTGRADTASPGSRIQMVFGQETGTTPSCSKERLRKLLLCATTRDPSNISSGVMWLGVRTRDSARRNLETNPHGTFAESTSGWAEWLADPGLLVASLETYAGA